MHAGDPTGEVPGEGEGEQGQQTYPAEFFPGRNKMHGVIRMLSPCHETYVKNLLPSASLPHWPTPVT